MVGAAGERPRPESIICRMSRSLASRLVSFCDGSHRLDLAGPPGSIKPGPERPVEA